MSTRDLPDQVGDLPRIGRPATGALLHVGVSTLAGVAAMTRAELSALHGVGPKAVRILEDALAERGLAFRDEEPGGRSDDDGAQGRRDRA